MKISANNNSINFKGYDAKKIKALYMQNAESALQQSMFSDLLKVGKKEGFDVFIHSKDKLISDEKDLPPVNYYTNNVDYWAQDNKIFIPSKDGGERIISTKPFLEQRFKEAEDVSKLTDIPLQETDLLLEGGNLFLGTKDNGENYIMVGNITFNTSSIYQFLKHKGVELTETSFKNFVEKGKIFKGKPLVSPIITYEEYEKEKDFWTDYTRKLFCKEFNVKEENIFHIPQANYHIDLTMRPLKYPYVLVNDDEAVKKTLVELEEKFDYKDDFISNVRSHLKEIEEDFEPSSVVKDKLEQYGFKPIMIPAALGSYNVNFLNAIVHERDNGLTYITNAPSWENDKRYEYLFNKFKNDISEKAPDIKRMYGITGGHIKDGNETLSMFYLRNYFAGVHCICAERPDFEEIKKEE